MSLFGKSSALVQPNDQFRLRNARSKTLRSGHLDVAGLIGNLLPTNPKYRIAIEACFLPVWIFAFTALAEPFEAAGTRYDELVG